MSIVGIMRTAMLAAAVGILSFAVAAAGQPIPGTGLDAAELVAELPWAFEVAVEAPAEAEDRPGSAAVKVTRYRFRSAEPYSSTAAGKVTCGCSSRPPSTVTPLPPRLTSRSSWPAPILTRV